ncbi:TSUP family transporter [Prescottella sp. R16]|uniref:TSUP family transporter n=1 Tax=Prescottella sp. R16 TaxID=3064529 RepID=UPI00272E447A|nr:TSUP family transporter [Prescottella sp. R16]
MSTQQLLLGTICAFAAAGLGGVVGFGFALVSTPLFLLLGIPLPTAVVINLLLGASTRLSVALRFVRAVEVPRVMTLLVGYVPGMVIGWLVLEVLPSENLRRMIGVLVLGAALVLAVTPASDRQFGIGSTAGVGTASGVMGMVASLNGIPPALMFAREGLGTIATLANLSSYFVVSNTVTAVVVTFTQEVVPRTVLIATACWLPAALVASYLATNFAQGMRVELFKMVVVAVIAVGGISVLLT